MERFHKKLLFICFSLLFDSCGKEKHLVAEVPREDLSQYTLGEFDSPDFKPFSKEAKKCLVGDKSKCLRRTVVHENGVLKKESEGQRILILDGEQQPFMRSSFIRFKGRVLSHYKRHSDARKGFRSFRPIASIPTVLIDIFERRGFLKDKGIEEYSRNDLFSLLRLNHAINRVYPTSSEVIHGLYIFHILADLNPQAQFVIAPFPEIDPKKFCLMAKDMGPVIEMYKGAARSLNKIIKKYKINYMNLSYVTTMDRLRIHNKNLCSGTLPESALRNYARAKGKFLDSIEESNPSLKVFQALPNYNTVDYLTDKDSQIFSCKDRKNFFTVGYWEKKVINVEYEREKNRRKFLPKDQNKMWPCTHLYVNYTPVKEEQKYVSEYPQVQVMSMLYQGVFRSGIGVMSTSFATPLALSYHNYLRQKTKETSYNYFSFWKKSLKEKVIDPNRDYSFLKYNS